MKTVNWIKNHTKKSLHTRKHQLKAMQQQGSGSIINVSSVLGRKGMPGASVYAASKHAVEGLTKVAALEVAASGIRVNVVAPGPIETPMLNRFVKDEETKEAQPAKRARREQARFSLAALFREPHQLIWLLFECAFVEWGGEGRKKRGWRN